MSLHNTYLEELKADTQVDEMSLKEKALLLPGLKAKWVARLITHKNSLNKLEKQKPKIINQIVEKLKNESPIKLHTNVIKEKAESCDEIRALNEKISEEKLVIDFLERVEKILSSMSFDISNIVKIVQLETT